MTHLNSADMCIFAKTFAATLKPGDWIFLNGDLGAGKTFLTKQILENLSAQSEVTSPTFPLLTCIQTSHNVISKICHLDLYRLKDWHEILYFGLEEELIKLNYVVIIEWSSMLSFEQWSQFFAQSQCPKPKRILQIDIEIIDENLRRLGVDELILTLQ